VGVSEKVDGVCAKEGAKQAKKLLIKLIDI
jgi:hypothetical protein